MSNYNSENHNKKVSQSYSTQELFLQVIREKLRKMKNSSNSEKNSTEVSGENITNVTLVLANDKPNVEKNLRENSNTNISQNAIEKSQENSNTTQYYLENSQKNSNTNVTNVTFSPDTSVENSSDYREKFNTNTNISQEVRENNQENSNTFVTNVTFSPDTSVENSSEEDEKNENEIEIRDNLIVIKTKYKYKFEIHYGFMGTIEDRVRIRDLKIPLLPQYELVAKKSNKPLSVVAIIDFYQTEDGNTIYYIRNKKEIVEKLYRFRAEKHISKRLINDALDFWLGKIKPEKQIQWVDVTEVVKKYKEWEEINANPLSFFLSRSGEVIGNEKLKVAVLLSVVSSQLKKVPGIYRVHLILTGSSGMGKSSTIKSILKLFYEMYDGVEDWIVLSVTKMTKDALGYLSVDTLDGKVIFVEQLDNIEGVNYLREAMSEGRISTLAPVKDKNGDIKTLQKVIPGQPSFITTNVTANINHQILNRSIQLYLSPPEDEKIKEVIINSILLRRVTNEEELSKLKLITYAWLKTRPKDPEMTKEVAQQLTKLLTRFINSKNIYRATEITRNLVRATASLFNHQKITKEDVDFIMKYFKKDIILSTMELSERDLQLLTWLRDHGFVQSVKEDETRDISTVEIAQVVNMSTQETKKVLDSLYDKGLVWKAYDGKKFFWAISRYGLRVLEELEKEVEEKQESVGTND